MAAAADYHSCVICLENTGPLGTFCDCIKSYHEKCALEAIRHNKKRHLECTVCRTPFNFRLVRNTKGHRKKINDAYRPYTWAIRVVYIVELMLLIDLWSSIVAAGRQILGSYTVVEYLAFIVAPAVAGPIYVVHAMHIHGVTWMFQKMFTPSERSVVRLFHHVHCLIQRFLLCAILSGFLLSPEDSHVRRIVAQYAILPLLQHCLRRWHLFPLCPTHVLDVSVGGDPPYPANDEGASTGDSLPHPADELDMPEDGCGDDERRESEMVLFASSLLARLAACLVVPVAYYIVYQYIVTRLMRKYLTKDEYGIRLVDRESTQRATHNKKQ